MNKDLEVLYRQQTNSGGRILKNFSVIPATGSPTGLLVLFTNFESMESLQRELPALGRSRTTPLSRWSF